MLALLSLAACHAGAVTRASNDRRVNVHFTGAAGAEDVPYVGTAARCDAARGGWYYDVDPATATPTRVLMCPRTCARFAADPGGQVQVGYGCKTQLIE